MGVTDPWGVAILDPGGLIGRFYVGATNHDYILNLLALSLILLEKIFESSLAI